MPHKFTHKISGTTAVVGERQLCGEAVSKAVKKAKREISPYELTFQMVFADLAVARIRVH